MKIDVRINSLTPDNGSIKAIASVNFDDCIAVKGVKVMEGKNGLFMSMPSQKGKDGNYHDIAFPLPPISIISLTMLWNRRIIRQ